MADSDLNELRNLFGSNVQKVEGKWYLIDERVIRICYSKAHSRIGNERYFFGLQKDKYEDYKSKNVHVLFVCGNFTKTILVSNAILDNLLKGVDVANDGSWKFDIHQRNNQFELIVTGKQPLNVSPFRIKKAAPPSYP